MTRSAPRELRLEYAANRAPRQSVQRIVRPLRRSQSLGKVLAEEGGDEPHRLVVLLRVGEEAVVAAVEVRTALHSVWQLW
jgi:hypothetical protein